MIVNSDWFGVFSQCLWHAQITMPIALKELASPDATNRRNAAYCIGELCKNGGDVALPYPFS
jgi:hypothetical protein